MKLHRSTKQADWEKVPRRRQNIWQRLAVATNGVVTPGNVVTILGLLVVLSGLAALLRHHYWLGLAALLAGRLSDIVDGWLADRAHTKSPLGELLDAAVDKICTGLTLLTFYVAHIAPGWLLVGLLLPHVVITVITIVAHRRHRRLHPSRLGKLSMAAAWLSIGGLLLVRALALHGVSLLGCLVYAVAGTSIIGSLVAAYRYSRGRI